jgi:DNA polymerase III subunit epsilon
MRHKIFREHAPVLVGFDTETTGLSVTSDRAISYGFYEIRNGEPANRHHFYVDPEIPVSDGAQRIHNISLDSIREQRPDAVLPFARGVERALELIEYYVKEGAVFVGANVVNFDLKMLQSSARVLADSSALAKRFSYLQLPVRDVLWHQMAMDDADPDAYKPARGLAKLCDLHGVSRGNHNALEDARAAAEVYRAQVEHNQKNPAPLSNRWGVAPLESEKAIALTLFDR